MEPPPAYKPRRAVLLLAAAMGMAIAAGAQFATAPFNLAWFIVAVWVSVAIHEMAHLLAGKQAGFETGGFSVAGFMALRTGDGWTFRFDPRLMAGGFAKPLPRKGDYRSAHYAWMVAAGPLASIAFAAAALGAMFHFGYGAGGWIASLMWGSAAVAVLSPIPSSKQLNRSDLSRVRQLLREPESSKSWMALLALQAENARGVRPREWDGELFERTMLNNGNDAENAHCNVLAYYRFADMGDYEAALAHLEYALAHCTRFSSQYRSNLFQDAAFACALRLNDAAKARTWLERAKKVAKPESTAAVEASLAICEGRWAEVSGHLAAAERYVVKRAGDSGIARFCLAAYAEMRADADERARLAG